MKNEKGLHPENFTLSLALVDAVPVILFSISCVYLYHFFHSTLFLIGAILAALAGCGKVLWKILVAAADKNIHLLNRQMRVLMPAGFFLMLLSLIVDRRLIDGGAMWHAISSFPSVIFFALFVLGMAAMGVLGKKMDSNKVSSNWIEQCTNGVAQLCLLIALLCIR